MSSAETSGSVGPALGRRPAQAAVPAAPLVRRHCSSPGRRRDARDDFPACLAEPGGEQRWRDAHNPSSAPADSPSGMLSSFRASSGVTVGLAQPRSATSMAVGHREESCGPRFAAACSRLATQELWGQRAASLDWCA